MPVARRASRARTPGGVTDKVTAGGETWLIYDPSLHLASLSLEVRLGSVRRRRRVSKLKQLLGVVGPVLMGIMLVLVLAAFVSVVEPGR
jgi:hypothetical protein